MAIEREIGVVEALDILRHLQREVGRRHRRIHQDAMAERVDRIRALHGPCGQCEYLNITTHEMGPKTLVKLVCLQGGHPTTLSKETPLGEEIKCDKFKERDENDR